MTPPRTPLRRLLAPATLAVAGGNDAAEAIRQCRRMGFAGEVWAINPRRAELAGLPCYPDVAALPAAPDACFVAVPRDETLAVVRALAQRGAGGAVCYASGFAEVGPEGAALQQRLLEAAGPLALLGPNCYGLVNYLDGCALWPDRAGGQRVARGVALLTQSGNIALNLSMQRHHLPVAYLAALGNMARLDFAALMDALLEDERVSAIGLHIEGLADIASFSAVALRALERGIPVVALKTGASALGARLAASHTSALAGPDACVDALFERCGVIRVRDLGELLETLKLLHACGPIAGPRIASLSCSGGEAALVADLGAAAGLTFPPLPAAVQAELAAVLGPQVPLANPLDYHTYIWGDTPALTRCFAAMLQAPVDARLLVLDLPSALLPGEATIAPGWDESLTAFAAAHARHPGPALVVATLPELMPDAAAARLLAAGIAPMQGLRDTLGALRAAATLAQARRELVGRHPVAEPVALRPGPARLLTEVEAKRALAAAGVPVPEGYVVRDRRQAIAAADALGYPVVLKAVAAGLAHKSELGAVHLNLRDADELGRAFDTLQSASPGHAQCLVERMARGALAEILVGVTRDPQFGLQLTLGSGGVLVELLADTTTLLLPATRADVARALDCLRCAPLLAGHRGKPAADRDALIAAIGQVLRFAARHADRLVELEINPLLALPRGAIAVDALLRLVD